MKDDASWFGVFYFGIPKAPFQPARRAPGSTTGISPNNSPSRVLDFPATTSID